MKSRLAVTKSWTRCPRFRLSVSAFRNTSGRSTAEPTLRYTPPSPRSATTAASRRKSRCVVAPTAAPSQRGCMWTMSVPRATCTVQGTSSRAHAASRLCARWGGRMARSRSPTARPKPTPRRAPSTAASLRTRPVSSAMPKSPSDSCASTSSEVHPAVASSKSCTAQAPLSATAVTNPRSTRSIRMGDSPTLMTWAPMPKRTGFPFQRASRIARATAWRLWTARWFGSVSR